MAARLNVNSTAKNDHGYRHLFALVLSVRAMKWAFVALLVLAAFSLGYILDPFNQSPLRLVAQVKSYVQGVPYPVFAFAIFIGVASLALVPLNILLIAAALIFPGWRGFFCGLFGALLATFLEYMIGKHLISAEYLESHLGHRFKAMKDRISANGLAAMTFLSFVPIAPHIVNNLVAGVCRIRIRDLILGSLIGLVPGLLIINILGRSVRKFIAQPNWVTAGLVVAVLIAMVWLSRIIRGYLSRKHQDHDVSPVH